MLLDGPYTRVAPSDVPALIGRCRQWLSKVGSMKNTA
jgi:hypothetical protein